MKIWFNGHLVERGALDASSAGVLMGWGVFTTLGIRGGAPRFLSRHVERLRRDAGEAHLDFAFDCEAIADALNAVLSANAVSNGIARLTLTQRGDGRWNHQNGADFSIFAQETAPSSGPLRVQLSPYRVEAKRPLAGVKTTSYLPYLWAHREAKSQGFDEAILRASGDFLCEGARATLFWMKNDIWFTPSLETGCLRGIGRELVLKWAREGSITVREGCFLASEAELAEAVCLVSGAQGPRWVSSWHQENGVLLREFAARGEAGRDLEAWWEQSD